MHPQNYLYALTVYDKYIPNFSTVLVLLVTGFILTMHYMFKKDKASAIFILFWIVFYVAFYGAHGGTPRKLRYWLPIIPPLIIMGISFFLMLKNYITLLQKKFFSKKI